jgi:UDP-3-O-[3-hydroxymyristoyl] glucosamine N-acyltransferase
VTVPPRAPDNAIDPSAKLAEGVRVGRFSVVEAGAAIGAGTVIGNGATIGEGCAIGANCAIGHGVVLHAGAELGEGCTVQDGAVLGRLPRAGPTMTHAIGAGHAPIRLGARCQIGANAVLYAGTTLADEVLVGDLASIREGCTVGARSIIGRGAMVEYGCAIGPRVKVQTGCYVTGETTIAEGAFLGPHVTMGNDKFMDRVPLAEMRGPTIGRGVRIGSNATILPGIKLGDDCAVGAGAVVTRDVAPGTIVAGVPARLLKSVPEDQRLRPDDEVGGPVMRDE